MDRLVYTLTAKNHENVTIHVTPGHFVSASSHMNYYVGTSAIKHNHNVSVDAAMLLSRFYVERGIQIDTVLCLYETQALGAYIAHELSRPSMLNPNPDDTVYVLGSEYDSAGNLIFRDNLKKLINGKNVLILISCITSGRTVARAMESVQYYGGSVAGVSAIFSATNNINGVPVDSIFTTDDIPGYEAYAPNDCPHCRAGAKVDAITNGYGYSKL